MQCAQCQHENREGAKFCNECATPLSLRCPSCETLNAPGAKFCDECATSLTGTASAPSPAPPATEPEREPLSYTPPYLAEKILTSRTALEGERKQVTVLFADIKDSTELIKDLDPEDAQKLLDPAIHIMMEAVHRFEGTVNQQKWLVLESASVSYGKATPYFPVVDLLKRYVHVEDGDDARTVRAKVTGQILTLDDSLQETIPALLSLLDALPEDSSFLQLDPPQRRRHTLDALKRILLRESQVQPLVLVFEDLHWIDSETQALLDSLIESLPTAQLFLLVNYRPEYQHSWGSKTYYTQLRLDPLPPTSADEFLEALLGDDPGLELLKKILIERTEGNPFFLEESVRTLVEIQVLIGEPGAYHLAQELPAVQVPATVQAVLAARIDRLPQEAKRLLQTAAVIGNEVPLSLLQSIAELPEEALHRSLMHLQTAEFLYETRLFPERVYTFKHALTHEVAYGSLLHERRRALHVQLVEALEALSGDQLADQIERLAHHAFRGEVYWLVDRYEDAQAVSVKAYERACETKERGHQAWALHLLGDIAMHRDPPEFSQVQAHYQQALTLANELGMRPFQAHCHRGLGTLYSQTGQSAQARAELSTAIDMYRDMEMTFWLPETEATLAEVEKR